MNTRLLTTEEWTNLAQAEKINDKKQLNQLLVSILRDLIESIGHDNDGIGIDPIEQMEKDFVLGQIEEELAELKDQRCRLFRKCRRQTVHPFQTGEHRFSNYFISLARAKLSDPNQTGFISKDVAKEIFEKYLAQTTLAQLFRYSIFDRNGNVQYEDFALLVFLSR